MTETLPEQNQDYDAPERDVEVSYLEYGPLPEARISLNFTPGKPPQLTVRAHTAAELTAALNELEDGGVYGAIGVAHASMGAQASIGAGLGPTTQIPQPAGPPAPPQGAPTPPPFGPNVSVPGAPAYAGPPAPMAPQAPPAGQWSGQAQGGAQGTRGPKPRPAWPQVFRIEVPMPAKDQFKQYREQNKDYFKGKVMWAGGGGYWIHGDIVQSFAPYNPVAA